MPNPELTPDFSRWMGVQMNPSLDDPNLFRSEPQEGIILTEEAYPEPRRGRKKSKTFWSVTIKVDNFYATGNDFDREAARNEARVKLKDLVSPLVRKLKRLGLHTPN